MTKAQKKRTRPRAKMRNTRQLARDVILLPVVDDGDLPARPKTRGECPQVRPCPWVGCRHHLYLDVNPKTGAIKFNFPDLEPWELQETCSLDVAEQQKYGSRDERGKRAATQQNVAGLMNVCRERVRQVERTALQKLGINPEDLK